MRGDVKWLPRQRSRRTAPIVCLPSMLTAITLNSKTMKGLSAIAPAKAAFRNMIDRIRKTLRKSGDDPLGEEDSDELSKAELDSLLQGEPEAAGIIHAAIEDFSQEFALIIPRFLKLKEWKNTERIVIGGGFRASRIGSLLPAARPSF